MSSSTGEDELFSSSRLTKQLLRRGKKNKVPNYPYPFPFLPFIAIFLPSKDGNGAGSDRVESLGTQNRNPN